MSRMHADEVDIDGQLVRRLLAEQCPRWSGLAVERVCSSGTVHAIYRLGSDMVVRLPRVGQGAVSLEKELLWLPRLGPRLPLAVPTPLAAGAPAGGYPWPWAVYRWIEGEPATLDRLADCGEAAAALAAFVSALHSLDPVGGPPPGDHNGRRGVPLMERDAATRQAIAALRGIVDTTAVIAAWDAALTAAPWSGPAVWVHGDLLETNLLARDGRLSAVIDFGCLGVGDPACDVMAAWTYLPAHARAAFRAGLAVDDATWHRARGWALSFALIALPYYKDTNPPFADLARRTIANVLADDAPAAR
jgi:aminoglycoside phosphotransferase (APT) family kinase protein